LRPQGASGGHLGDPRGRLGDPRRHLGDPRWHLGDPSWRPGDPRWRPGDPRGYLGHPGWCRPPKEKGSGGIEPKLNSRKLCGTSQMVQN
jgi:hypothetical protein